MKTREILFIAMAVSVTFSLEQALLFLPNVQLTVLLIILFTSVMTYKHSMIYIIVYVLLDTLLMGGFNLLYMVPMLLGWSLIPLMYHTVLGKTKNELYLALFALMFGFVYGWMFIPFNMIQTGIDNFLPYLISDIPFEIIMGTSGFVSVYWLYRPTLKVLETIHEGSQISLHVN